MDVNNPSGSAQFPAATVVHNGAAPAAYTDLNLSAVVGSRPALVLLSLFKNVSTADGYYLFRKNGETANQDFQGTGAFYASNNTSYMSYVVCRTDAAGVCEWKATNTDSVQIRVEAFIYG